MKKKALIAAVLAATTLTATTAFAAQNPFKDLPEGHWAYDAVTMLAQDGVLDGYGDGNFNGNKLMNRYEMAEIVSKAMAKYDGARPQDKGAIKKLEKEFGAELKDMDVRLKGVEEDVKELKKGQSSFKMYGDARFRYFQNKANKLTNNYAWRDGKGSQFEERVRLGIYAEPAKNIVVDGRIKYENEIMTKDGWGASNQNFNSWDNSTRDQNSFRLDKMSVNWSNAGSKLSIGRIEMNLGQGGLWWENSIDGVTLSHQFGPKVNVMAGYGDIAAEGWHNQNMPSQFANISVKTSPATTFTVANLHTNTALKNASTSTSISSSTSTGYPVYDSAGKVIGTVWPSTATGVSTSTTWTDSDYQLNQYAVGINTQMTKKWNLIAEGIRNNVGVAKYKNGFWTRVTYGNMAWNKGNTWKVYAEYFALGGGAVDSTYWGHRLNIAGGNGFNGAGDRGWGVAGDYMLAANYNLELCYYKLKPFDSSVNFSRYNDVVLAALTCSF